MNLDGIRADIKRILYPYLAVNSETCTDGEKAAEEFLLSTLGGMEYFQKHPDHYGAFPIPGDPYGRAVCWALVQGLGDRTVVLLHHYDVVNTEDFKSLKALAFDPDALHKALLEMKQELHGLPKEAADDLASGEFLFGRGTADMKAGGAIQLALMDRFSKGSALAEDTGALAEAGEAGVSTLADNSVAPVEPRLPREPGLAENAEPGPAGNLLLLALPDEENLSAGMRGAITLLSVLKQRFSLRYVYAIDSEPHQRKDKTTGVISEGSVGKTLAFVYVRGSLSHAGKVFEGLNPLSVLSRIAAKTELSPLFSDTATDAIADSDVATDLASDSIANTNATDADATTEAITDSDVATDLASDSIANTNATDAIATANATHRQRLSPGREFPREEASPPPTWLYLRDRKKNYDASMPLGAGGCLSVLTLNSEPAEILDALAEVSREAFRETIDNMNASFGSFCNNTGQKHSTLPWEAKVCTFGELLAEAEQNHGDQFARQYDEKLNNITAEIHQKNIDFIEASFLLTEFVFGSIDDLSPRVVLGLVPPYYPNTSSIKLKERQDTAESSMTNSPLRNAPYITLDERQDSAELFMANSPPKNVSNVALDEGQDTAESSMTNGLPKNKNVSNVALDEGQNVCPVLAEKLIAFARERFGQKYDRESYFTGISDMSYFSMRDSAVIEKTMLENMPLYGKAYSIPLAEIEALSMPCMNIGPWGKDFHKLTERVSKTDLYERTPALLAKAIETILSE